MYFNSLLVKTVFNINIKVIDKKNVDILTKVEILLI